MNRPTLAPVIARIDPAVTEKQSLPMLPWFPAAFMSSTRGWSVTARGIYRELLDAQWDLGGLPAAESELKLIIKATRSEWKKAPIVLQKFPLCEDGLRRNPTLESIRLKSAARAEKHRRGAGKTNAKRWGARVTRLSDEGSNDDL